MEQLCSLSLLGEGRRGILRKVINHIKKLINIARFAG
jgi:hypothetical protein